MVNADKYDYIDEGSINERLTCAICSNPFIQPMKTKCKPTEHTFCHNCIKDWLQRQLSCPTCRRTLRTEHLTTVSERILIDMLDDLLVKCPFCQRKGLARGALEEHINKQCSNRQINCSSVDISCSWSGSPEQLQQHLQTCPYTALRAMITRMITDNRRLSNQVAEQQNSICTLQEENQRLQAQVERPAAHTPALLENGKPPRGGRRFFESKSICTTCSDVIKHVNTCFCPDRIPAAVPLNRSTPTPATSCTKCTDCWRGAVRGAYFRGHTGGGLQLGSTLVPCGCACHE